MNIPASVPVSGLALPACPLGACQSPPGDGGQSCAATGRSRLEVGSGAEPPRHQRMNGGPRPPTLLQAWPPESSPRRSPALGRVGHALPSGLPLAATEC